VDNKLLLGLVRVETDADLRAAFETKSGKSVVDATNAELLQFISEALKGTDEALRTRVTEGFGRFGGDPASTAQRLLDLLLTPTGNSLLEGKFAPDTSYRSSGTTDRAMSSR
jgi:hypothetical protein